MPPSAISDPTVVILMGVSGSGKTTVGRRLAAELDWPFYEGDDFHPPENVAKMASGVPLTDVDRGPWLEKISELIDQCLERKQSAVISCSALKERYRGQLRRNQEEVVFVYLKGEYEVIFQRMQSRPDHYMKPAMLQTQYQDLEPPGGDEAITVSVEADVEVIVKAIGIALRTRLR